jgi:hypothetical protein
MRSVVTGTSGIAAAAERLGDLADNLDRRSFTAQLVTGSCYPYVNVANRVTSALCETIYAAPARDGSWWFWWSWTDRIAPVEDVEATASRIYGVLAIHD